MFKDSVILNQEEYVSLAPSEVQELCLRRIPPDALFQGAYLMTESKRLRVAYIPYQAGDIVGVLGGALSQASYRIFEPPTRLFHFLIVGEYIPNEDDYVIYEAIGSGVRTGRLSWYAEDLYVVFRLTDPQSRKLGVQACREASRFGRWGYDYLMYLYLLLDLPVVIIRNLLKERRLRRVRPDELPYHENHAFICTEFAAAVWREVGRDVIQKGVIPLPAGYIEAYKAGRLKRVGSNTPDKYRYIFYSRDILPNLYPPKEAKGG